MIPLNKLIANIQNSRGGGSPTDDLEISDRQVEFILDHFRAEIVAQRVNNNKSIDGLYQELNNVKLIATKDFRPYREDVTILRSREKLPSMVSAHDNGYVIDFVGPKDALLGFHKSSVSLYNLDSHNPYIRNLYFISDGYLYIATKDRNFLRGVYTKAAFNSPREVRAFEGFVDNSVDFEWSYPIPGNLIGSLNNMAMNNEFRWAEMFPSDDVNDGKDAKQ